MTAHDEHAVDAFDLNAVDYVLKPVREERLAEAVRRVVEGAHRPGAEDDQIPVELGGVTRFVAARDIRYVEAQGDYARLHTADGQPPGAHPAHHPGGRVAPAGFVRIHRSLLVVPAPRRGGPHRRRPVHRAWSAAQELAVSRRHTRELRDLLVRRNRPGSSRDDPGG